MCIVYNVSAYLLIKLLALSFSLRVFNDFVSSLINHLFTPALKTSFFPVCASHLTVSIPQPITWKLHFSCWCNSSPHIYFYPLSSHPFQVTRLTKTTRRHSNQIDVITLFLFFSSPWKYQPADCVKKYWVKVLIGQKSVMSPRVGQLTCRKAPLVLLWTKLYDEGDLMPL